VTILENKKAVFQAVRIETPRLILRELTLEDSEDLFCYASRDEVTKYLPWETHISIKDSENYIRDTIKKYAAGDAASWGIVLKEANKLIGTCGFVSWSKSNCCAEIGFALSSDYWNQGIMTEAAKSIIKFGFSEMGLNRIEAMVVVDNIASQKVCKKIGMDFEGILKEKLRINGVFKDVNIYSVLRRNNKVEK